MGHFLVLHLVRSVADVDLAVMRDSEKSLERHALNEDVSTSLTSALHRVIIEAL